MLNNNVFAEPKPILEIVIPLIIIIIINIAVRHENVPGYFHLWDEAAHMEGATGEAALHSAGALAPLCRGQKPAGLTSPPLLTPDASEQRRREGGGEEGGGVGGYSCLPSTTISPG